MALDGLAGLHLRDPEDPLAEGAVAPSLEVLAAVERHDARLLEYVGDGQAAEDVRRQPALDPPDEQGLVAVEERAQGLPVAVLVSPDQLLLGNFRRHCASPGPGRPCLSPGPSNPRSGILTLRGRRFQGGRRFRVPFAAES